MGRPPKAPTIRIADGTHRKDRHGPAETLGAETLISEAPKPPSKRRAVFNRWWKHYSEEMVRVGVLTSRDLAALEMLCDARQDESDARDAIKRDGDYFPTMSGMARHPAFTTLEKARAFVHQAQQAMGFSPVGRFKVPPVVGVAKSNKVQGLNRKA